MRRRLLLCVLVAGGCRQVLGIETRTEGDPPLTLGDACSSCVALQCESAERACAADAACAAAADCMAQAGKDNPIGRRACLLEHAAAATSSTFASLDGCLRAPCQDACYGGSGFFARFSDSCRACVAPACQGPESECVADPECESLAVGAYADPTSLDPNALQPIMFAAGEAGASRRALGYCPVNTCAAECGFDGRDLACVSDFAWPNAAPASLTIELEVAVVHPDFSLAPLPGARVDECLPFQDGCVVGATYVTDATGLAIGEVSGGVSGFRGFTRITGTAEGEPLYPTHLLAYPLMRSGRGGVTVVTESLAAAAATAFAGGLVPGRAHLFLQLLDCRIRRPSGLLLDAPAAALEDATVFSRPRKTTALSSSTTRSPAASTSGPATRRPTRRRTACA